MLIRTLLAATAALALTGAAQAQDAAPQAAPAAPAAAPMDEAAFEARAERFEQQVDQMTRELQAAGEAGGGDRAVTMASVDEILARYQPEFEGFARDFEAFFNARIAASEDEEARAELTAARDAAIPVILAIPTQIRAGAEAQFAAAETASDAAATAADAE
jgi:hypothetical protein